MGAGDRFPSLDCAQCREFLSETGWTLRPLRLGVRRLDDFMRHSFKVMHDEVYTVKVRISPGWARWVGEKIWHESQKAKKNGDGTLELSFRVGCATNLWVNPSSARPILPEILPAVAK